MLVVIVVLALIYIFSTGPKFTHFMMNSVGPPPEDSAARQAWLSETIKPADKQIVVLDEELPSWRELDKMNKEFEGKKIYPKYIKAVQTYNTVANLVEVLYFDDVLEDLGVNTQFVHANHWFKKGEFEYWYTDLDKPRLLNQNESKRALVYNILLAKQKGLAVILFPDYVELENNGMNKLGITTDLEERLETVALDLAEIAEKYNVEYLVPVNQIEMILNSNGYGVEETQERTNAFYASVVPKIKKVYSGKIMYKMGGFMNWNNYDQISLEGADIFGFTGCYNRNRNDVNFVVSDIRIAAAQARELSSKYEVPWINAEFVISDEPISGEHVIGKQITEPQPIEDYYKAGLAAFNKYGTTAEGFTVHSLLTSGKIYNTPAFDMIKKD